MCQLFGDFYGYWFWFEFFLVGQCGCETHRTGEPCESEGNSVTTIYMVEVGTLSFLPVAPFHSKNFIINLQKNVIQMSPLYEPNPTGHTTKTITTDTLQNPAYLLMLFSPMIS